MSCDRTANRTANASISAGLTRLAAKSAYARAARRNLALVRRALAAVHRFLAGTPAAPTAVPQLDAVQTVAPTAPPPGQTCAGCGRDTGQPGPWYRIAGQTHCADCAPAAAQHAGVTLAVAKPHSSTQTPAGVSRLAAAPSPSTTDGRPVTITKEITATPGRVSKSVELAGGGSTRVNVDGYRLRTAAGQETGLAVTPFLAVENGQVRPQPGRWRVTHIASGRDVVPLDFPTPEAALGLGRRLGQFDWNRPFEAFSRRELATLRATLGASQNTVPQPQPEKSGLPLDKPLHNQLVVDSSGEVVRVFDDLGETLVVTDVLGQSYTVSRLEVRLPDEQDFAQTNLAYPLSDEELLNENRCTECRRPVGQDDSTRWYRLRGQVMCDRCARALGPLLNLSLPDTTL